MKLEKMRNDVWVNIRNFMFHTIATRTNLPLRNNVYEIPDNLRMIIEGTVSHSIFKFLMDRLT